VEFRTSVAGREVVEIIRAGDSLFTDTSVPYDARGHSTSAWPAPADAIQVYWSAAGTEPPIFDEAAPREELRPAKRKPRRTRISA